MTVPTALGAHDNEFSPTFPTCLGCRFYVPNPQADHGVCHRYPKAEIVSYSYWCGEFRESRGLETK